MALGTFLAARRRMAGLSLIEMMIALVMALIVAAGIITVFTSTSSSNKVQQQMAALQEEGRFAIHSLRSDLVNANGNYCSNTGGNASSTAAGVYQDSLRSPTIYAQDPITFRDNTLTLPTPTEAYSLPSSIFMRGYDCDNTAGTCTPVDPNTTVSAIPKMGTDVGKRVIGADVLTIRYVKPGSGWAITPTGDPGSHMTTTGGTTTIALSKLPGEDPVSDFTGTLAMLADCSNAQVFAVTNGGGSLTVLGTNSGNYAQPLDITKGAAPRVFDFTQDFQTVTYWLKVVCTNGTDPCTGTTTGELERRVNGTDYPLVRGVERLDFRYGIIDANGGTRFLTANEVDTGTDMSGNSIPCHVVPGTTSDVTVPGNMPNPDPHCLWRAVQTIEVSILMDGQTPLYTLTPNEMNYVYTPDGTALAPPASHTITPVSQGFPTPLLRRQFITLVALRNFNP